jgi:RND family efflux transporter MFP subunit
VIRFVLLVMLATACNRDSSGAGNIAAITPAAVRVRTVAATTTKLEGGPVLIGRLEPYERATLAVRLAGVLTDVRVDVGDRVKSGQVLASLQVPGLAAQVDAAAANSDAARHEAELRGDSAKRTAAIADSNKAAISEQEVLAAKAQLATADARAAAATADARRLKALADDTRLVAPFEGVIVARKRDRGASVSAGDGVLEVARVDRLRLRIEIPEAQAAAIAVGATVSITLPTLGQRTLSAAVSRFAPALDARTRMLPVEIDVANTDGGLLAGVRAEARLGGKAREGVLTVPSEAVLVEDGASVVYVAAGDVAHRRVVHVGYDNGVVAEILDGVKPGELVALGGRGLLRDGTAVEVAK